MFQLIYEVREKKIWHMAEQLGIETDGSSTEELVKIIEKRFPQQASELSVL